MSIILCLIWGALVCCIQLLTIKYYLPRLRERSGAGILEPSTSEEDESEDALSITDEKKPYQSVFLSNRVCMVLILILCAGFSIWCGYAASENALSWVSLIKMTVGMCVLSCVFITDMELMLIPNICSVILLATRLLLIIVEFIWFRDEVVSLLLNSAVALIVGLVFLLLMSRITGGGLGMGDIKILVSLGFLCGIRAMLFTLCFSFLLCALASTFLLLMKIKKIKDTLPLGPFLWIGYGVTVLLSLM